MSSSSLLSQRDLCFIDTETTGPRFDHHELLEVAAIRTSPDGHIERGVWHHRVQPRHPDRMTDHARRLTNYTDGAWAAGCAASAELWQSFAAFAAGSVPVCHNPSFDRAFLSLAAASCGVHDLGVDYHWIGTESLAWPAYKAGMLSRLSLATLCDHLGVEREPDVHNALDGARACRRAYLALIGDPATRR